MTVFRAGAIYEALFDDEALADLPALLARSADARSTMLHWRHVDRSHELIAYSYFTATFMALYTTKYCAMDPWVVVGALRAKANEVTRLEQFVPPSVFETSRINREFVRPQGDDTFHCAGAVFSTPWGEGLLGVHRSRTAPAFEDSDLGVLKEYASHLRRMLQVRGELIAHRRGERLARDALDSFTLGAVLAHADGRIAQANLAAEIVLRRADGLKLAKQRLTCADQASRGRLEAALAAATAASSPSARAIMVERGECASAYLVSVSPIVGANGPAMALLVFRDPDAAETSLEPRLRSLFSLTAIEAAIAADLARGLGAPSIAIKRGVKPNTIKTQLASLAAKMGCGRQAEIAARVAGLPPVGLG